MTVRLAHPERSLRRGAADLEIALLNNMPDRALRRTEGQFLSLLDAASGARRVRLRLCSLPALPRGADLAAHLGRFYAPLESLAENPPDGMIITGAEPRTADLTHEIFWPGLCDVMEFAARRTRSCFLSCLAAHAAVLHFDAVARRRLPTKCTGIFAHEHAAPHPLTTGIEGPIRLPHSRWNGLEEEALPGRGYRALLHAPAAGVGVLVKSFGSLFVFSQPHPEYGAEMPGREYRRDVRRYLDGQQPTYPDLPLGVFPSRLGARLLAFRDRARIERDPALFAEFPALPQPSAAPWRDAAVTLFANWLDLLAPQFAASAFASAGAAGAPANVVTPASHAFATAGCALR